MYETTKKAIEAIVASAKEACHIINEEAQIAIADLETRTKAREHNTLREELLQCRPHESADREHDRGAVIHFVTVCVLHGTVDCAECNHLSTMANEPTKPIVVNADPKQCSDPYHPPECLSLQLDCKQVKLHCKSCGSFIHRGNCCSADCTKAWIESHHFSGDQRLCRSCGTPHEMKSNYCAQCIALDSQTNAKHLDSPAGEETKAAIDEALAREPVVVEACDTILGVGERCGRPVRHHGPCKACTHGDSCLGHRHRPEDSLPPLCPIPPAGWFCTIRPPHKGPCAALPVLDGYQQGRCTGCHAPRGDLNAQGVCTTCTAARLQCEDTCRISDKKWRCNLVKGHELTSAHVFPFSEPGESAECAHDGATCRHKCMGDDCYRKDNGMVLSKVGVICSACGGPIESTRPNCKKCRACDGGGSR